MDNTEKNNKLIAEFMGGKYLGDDCWGLPNSNEVYDILHYHTSWGWLMPVVEKINSLEYRVQINHNNTLIFDGDIIINPPFGYGNYSMIDCTYDAVINFINLYNTKNNDK